MIWITNSWQKIAHITKKYNTSREEDYVIWIANTQLNTTNLKKNTKFKIKISQLPITIICIQSFYETKVKQIASYKEQQYNNNYPLKLNTNKKVYWDEKSNILYHNHLKGTFYYEEQYSNILFPKANVPFTINLQQFLPIPDEMIYNKYFLLLKWLQKEKDILAINIFEKNELYDLSFIQEKNYIVLSYLQPATALAPNLNAHYYNWVDKIGYEKWYYADTLDIPMKKIKEKTKQVKLQLIKEKVKLW